MLTRSFMDASSPQDLVAYTPMLHARMFTETSKFRDNHFQPLRTSLTIPSTPATSSNLYLDGNPSIDRPLFVQFCANNPDEFLSAAKYVSPFCDAVDLNLGCPQGIARKGKYGAFLQEEQSLIFSLINKLHKELDIPVTAKIRVLETREKTLQYAKMALDAGASIITVHGRTREMKGHKTGLADWGVIRYLREHLPKETVLFANGNILKKEDVERCLLETGADGVMSAEGNLYDPAIFSTPPPVGEEGREYWRGRDGKGGWRMDAVFRRYMDILYKYVLETPIPYRQALFLPSDPLPPPPPPAQNTIQQQSQPALIPTNSSTVSHKQKRSDDEEATNDDKAPKKKQKQNQQREGKTKREKTSNPNLLAMQPHLFHLLRPLVARHHPVRDALARCRAGDIAAFENVLQMVESVVREGLVEYERTNGESWERELREDRRLQDVKASETPASRRGEGAGNGEKAGKDGDGDGDVDMDESSVETVRACKRPWWVVQPYVRPLPKEALLKGSLTLSKKERLGLEKAAPTSSSSDIPPGILPKRHAEVERVGGSEGKAELEVEVPKEGLVCG